MWLVNSRSQVANGARLVKYALLTLIIFMLVCTSLAIILVSFASDYSPVLHDRTQGVIFILIFITFIYSIGLIGVWRSNLTVLVVFATGDVLLSIICILSTHQGHHIGNLGALIVFSTASILSAIVILQTLHQRSILRASSVQNASVNCYQHVPDDWYDCCGTGSHYCSSSINEKDKLITNQFSMPCNCHCSGDVNVDEIFATTPTGSSTFCTIETTEEGYLNGDRYAV